ncbi:MAG: hypothetical protein AB1546_06755 [bacterium]
MEKTIIDYILEGGSIDEAIAKRLKQFLSKGSPKVALHAMEVYEKLPEEKKREFEGYGLTPQFMEKMYKKVYRR